MKRAWFRKVISAVLACATLASAMPFIGASAAQTDKYPYAVFAGGSGNSLDFGTSGVTINGGIHTNGAMVVKGNYANINGTVGAVGGIIKGQGAVNISKVTDNPANETTIAINQKVKSTYFTNDCDSADAAYTKSDVNVNINKALYGKLTVGLSGNISINAPVGAYGDISLDGGTLNSNNAVIYSQSGNITINSGNATVNGLIYAPNGKVTVTGQNFQVNGIIIAKEIAINATNVSINYSDSVAAFVGNTSEADTNADLIDIGKAYFKDFADSDIQYDGNGIYYVKNQLLLTASNQLSFDDVSAVASQYGAKIVGYIQLTNDYQIQFDSDKSIEQLNQLMDEFRQNTSVEYATLNTVMKSAQKSIIGSEFIPNDSEYQGVNWSESDYTGLNWGLKTIKAPSAWSYIDKMQSVKVGLIDSCFDTCNEDLSFTQVWNNPVPITDSHGTEVAGVMAADFNNGKGIAGVIPKRKLYAYALENKNQTYHTMGYCSAMQYKYALALLIGNNVKVINYSYGYDYGQIFSASRGNQCAINAINADADIMGNFLEKLINEGYDFDIVTAAGNENEQFYIKDNSTYGYRLFDSFTDKEQDKITGTAYAKYCSCFNAISTPCVESRIICVGGFRTSDNEHFFVKSWWSDIGNRVDIIAPDESIHTCDTYSTYGNPEGTSVGAPFVSGIAGMLYSVNPELSGAQVKSIITHTSYARTVSDKYGDTYNIADAYAAVSYAILSGACTPPAAPPKGTVMGVVSDVSGHTISDAEITAYKFDSSAGNLGDYSTSAYTNSEGQFELFLSEGQYYININKEGYIPVTEYVYVYPEEVTYLEKSLMVDYVFNALDSTVKGYVTDSLTGSAVNGATIKYRSGWNNKWGNCIKDLFGVDMFSVANDSGGYSINLPAGNYTAEISKDGYITGYANVVSSPGFTQDQNIVLEPVLPDNEYRIVLTWGETPSDLDSHLTGPTESSGRFHVYFANRSNADGTATLDRDDTSSFGPETITLTLKPDLNGVYRYSVYDYSDGGSTTSNALSLSGATVKVYKGNGLVRTYSVPANVPGTLWTVFEIYNGEINTVNQIGFNGSL